MKFQYIIETPILLRTFLQENQYSKKMISAIKQSGALLVNDTPVTVRKQMVQGDYLEVVLPSEVPSVNLECFVKPITPLYEDDYYIAVSKPPHQNCAPSREHPHESLLEQVLAYLNSNQQAPWVVPHIITRLDRNTSGIVLFAKHGHFHHRISDVEMEKVYHCICFGQVEPHGEIIAPIARASDSIINREVSEAGKYAKTSYTLITQNQDYALCRVQLHTGRTHQIRVHFQYIGHPLVGDSLYGGYHEKADAQSLVCTDLSFKHPVENKHVVLKDEARHALIERLFRQLSNDKE